MSARRGPHAPPPASLVDALAEAVAEVGALLRQWRSDPAATAGRWHDGQFKAGADTRAHDALSARLRRISPSTPVISEEDPGPAAGGRRPDRYWLIDPLDGTASYAHGFPGYVTQATLMVDARPLAAAVHAPETGVLYTAVHGMGAAANGRMLPRVAPAPPGTGVLTDNTPEPGGIARAAYDHFGYGGYLECGGISLKLCRIAEGAAHLLVKDVPVRDWDVAAPDLLLRETGCHLSRLDGTPFDYRGDLEGTGVIGAADPGTGTAVASWHREREGHPIG
ncbi:3'(2'),5'-bisphosphate nucleotidase CysQ [Nocardiopsis sediminis]|uniref:3'(2'),5'-bisphosphate nucleotidase CysQ n=1 Tax=Nocardiopsis sediminis TaxID=1778267 RepID=A0ABV8FSM3_9ACTN